MTLGSSKHGMGWASRGASWRGCMCHYCRPHGTHGARTWFKRMLQKGARQQGKREIQDARRD